MFLSEKETSRQNNARNETNQDRLTAISASIDLSKLPGKKALHMNKDGKVAISSSHPDFNDWVKGDKK